MYHTSIMGGSFLGGSFPRGQFSRGQFFSGGSFPGGRFQGALFRGALFRGAVFLEPSMASLLTWILDNYRSDRIPVRYRFKYNANWA